jgi:hypothetical protein
MVLYSVGVLTIGIILKTKLTRNMGRVLQLILIVISTSSLSAQSIKYLSTFDKSSGKPHNLVSPSDAITDKFISRLRTSLPEYYPVPKYNPQYLTDDTETDIRLSGTTELWVTFVDEGAGHLNTLAFYTYTGSKLNKAPSELTVVFPNLSMTGSGGDLQRGQKVSLGKFPAGTNIGFALISNGYTNANGVVTSGRNIFYTTEKLNPEPKASQKRHSVLLRDIEGMIVLGFEDLRRDQSPDDDFNDAVVYITAADKNMVITDNVNGTFGSGVVSSGNNGGLESEGSLAGAIALRNFQKTMTPSVDYDNPDLLKRYKEPTGSLTTRGVLGLDQFIPQRPFFDPVTPYISTPKDLIGITNAKQVMSVDYFDDATKSRIAAVLSTQTNDKVYNHTKITCDRLIGSTLEHTETILIDSMPFIRSTLTRPDGTYEYAISFSIAAESETAAKVMSRWSVDNYPSKSTYWNFQVWAEAPHFAQKVVEEILAKTKTIYPTISGDVTPALPKVFVKNGQYDNGILTLTLKNPTGIKSLNLNGKMAATETTQRTDYKQVITLKGDEEETIKVSVGTLYDLGFSLGGDATGVDDVLYFADGTWGIDYDRNIEKVAQFEVENSTPSLEKDIYTIERDPQLRGVVKNYVSLFRTLRPAGEVVDATGFKNLSFTAKGSGIVQVTLLKKSITEWGKQYRTEINLNDINKDFRLALKDFSNGTSEPLKADDLSSIVFTMKGDGKTEAPFNMQFENIAFDNKAKLAADFNGEITFSPNPVTETGLLTFKMDEQAQGVVSLINGQGQVFFENKNTFVKGRNDIPFDFTHVPAGVYIINIVTQKGIKSHKVLVQ